MKPIVSFKINSKKKGTIIKSILFFFFYCCFGLIMAQTTYKTYTPCSFTIQLPNTLTLRPVEEEDNLDYCDFEAAPIDSLVILQIHSMTKGRFDAETIDDFYQNALQTLAFKPTYTLKKKNYFILSGIHPETGNIIYWKRVIGDTFVSDLVFDYSQSRAYLIEPQMKEIVQSFRSQ